MTNDLKALLAVIEQYHVPNIEIEPYLVPFDINYIAAVGDVHPGFGIPRPDGLEDHLGLVVLDEPAGKQSNSTVINMILSKDQAAADVPIKKLQRADRNTRQIDQWIENIKP
uniref:Intraflagellar transport protein 46 homolog n=1 Tax=Panagrolaimus superbus TaxID=310955 RepID=A0A914YVL7_9BILA